ncbi:MAG: hypothetical protein ACRDJE_10785 [Dehalococcoidia bacterium]
MGIGTGSSRSTFETLRQLVLHYARRRGWRTQRHIAVACGFDESGLSCFLNGEQDIGAWRTHALFQEIGVPPDHYDLAYTLLGHALEQARALREARLRRQRSATLARHADGRRSGVKSALRSAAGVNDARLTLAAPAIEATYPPLLDPGDIPVATVIARFAAERYTSEQIAAFFQMPREPAS